MAVKIQNVVATADLKQRIDATRLKSYSWGVYDQAYYGGLCGYIKDEHIPGRVTVFFTGKVISVGAKSIQQSIGQLEHALDLMVKEGLAKRVKLEPQIRNIVGTTQTNTRLDLNKIVTVLEKSVLEPEVFPGVIHRVADHISCLIFSNGKIVIAGATTQKQLTEVAARVLKRIEKFSL